MENFAKNFRRAFNEKWVQKKTKGFKLIWRRPLVEAFEQIKKTTQDGQKHNLLKAKFKMYQIVATQENFSMVDILDDVQWGSKEEAVKMVEHAEKP